MIIRTSQDAITVSCCPCNPPACNAPRKECQSISAEACGYTLPQVPGMPRTDFCLMFKTLSNTLVQGLSQTISGDGIPTTVDTGNETDVTVTKIRYIGGACSEYTFSTSYDNSERHTVTPYGSTTPSSDYSRHAVSSSGVDGVCNYSATYVDHLDATNNETSYGGGCANIFGIPDDTWSYASPGIYTRSGSDPQSDTYEETATYSDPVTAADIDAVITSKLAALAAGAAWGGAGCSSKIGSSKTYSIQDPPAPPAEVDPAFVPVVVCSQVTSGIKARYKIGIPSDWADFDGRHATWVTAHAAWVAASPETRGTEPIEPTERTYFAAQWDEVFFPAAWEAWKVLKVAHDTAVTAHAAWVAAPGDPPAIEPVVPPAPGTEPTAPTLVTSHSWSYTGGGGTSEFSDWFVIAVPTEEGETRVVNMLTKCHRNTKLGVKPTATGEVYEL